MNEIFWILLAVAAVAFVVVYLTVVRSQIAIANEAMGKWQIVADAQTFAGKVQARLLNLKTVILGVVSAVTGIFANLSPDIVQAWGALPWSTVLDQKVAGWISIVCAALVPIVHAMGLAKAATTPPQNQD